MKLKHLLPVTLLAVLALAACDPVDTSSSSDPSSDTPSDSEVEESALKDIIAGLPVGEVDEAGLTEIFDNFGDVSLGLKQSAFMGQAGLTPDILNDPSTAYMEYLTGAGAIDGDVVQVAVETELSLAESDGAGGYVLGEEFADISEVTTVWKDDTNVHMANVVNEDPADDYSFLATSAVADVDIELFKDFVNSGDLFYYAALADEAFAYFSSTEDFVEVTSFVSAEKIVDEETSEVSLYVKYYTLGSWFGLYSMAAVRDAKGYPVEGYEDIYIDRGEVWGFEAYVNAEGVLDAVYTYDDHFINWNYQDLNYEEGDPVPNDPLTQDEIDALDLVLIGEGWGYVYGVRYHEFSSEAPDALVVPSVDGLRAADASDASYLFDPADYGFVI
jgi:hypothetical protein